MTNRCPKIEKALHWHVAGLQEILISGCEMPGDRDACWVGGHYRDQCEYKVTGQWPPNNCWIDKHDHILQYTQAMERFPSLHTSALHRWVRPLRRKQND